MINILYVVSTLKRSGPTNQLFNIIKNLDRSAFKPHLVTLSPESSDSRWSDYEKIGVNLYSLNLSRLSGVLFSKSSLGKKIADIKPDIIHSQGIRADMLVSKINSIIPNVATIHNFPEIDYKMTYGSFLSYFMLKNHVKAMRRLKRVVGCSFSVSENLIDRYSLSNVNAIQNGVDQDYFNLINLHNFPLRDKLKIGYNDKVWISTGHLSDLKDPFFLIDLWHKATKEAPNHHLIFLGSGALYDECYLKSEKKKNIHILGRVSNVVDYLLESDYFISASKSEGLPMAVIEAMACGLPVLLSDIQPHKEIYNMSPEIGCLFKLGEEHSFLESFKELVESDYSIHRQAALDLIKSELSAVKMSQKYQNIYKQLIGNK
ncbi:glycosyltransferase [Vibrio sp. Vb0877]|uniref:glycosyltransferase n=1 Tax=Vibrio sp. Vb0877 TaxID=2816073 RepID=UPI001A8E47FB|nr:glycosyltransferase [Vibrio sp. Vb0877]MBO0208193.1 glycosyltransferase [Vibrio sp. Vb0877]